MKRRLLFFFVRRTGGIVSGAVGRGEPESSGGTDKGRKRAGSGGVGVLCATRKTHLYNWKEQTHHWGKEAFVKEFFSAVRHGAAAEAPDEVSELGDAGAGRVRVRYVRQPDGAQASGHEQQDGDPEHERVYGGRRPAGAGRAGHLSAVHGVHGADDGHQRQKLSDLRSVQRAHEQRHRREYRGHRGHQGVWPRGRVL